jgi:hypothetical protein
VCLAVGDFLVVAVGGGFVGGPVLVGTLG